MECARLGVDGVGRRILESMIDVVSLSGWSALGCLPSLHAARRALLRARLLLAHLLEPAPRQPERWQPAAAEYMTFALRALDEIKAL